MVARRTPVAIRTAAARKGLSDTEVIARLGRVLRAVRTVRGLTQRDLAQKLGISQNHLSNLEKGKREPGIVFLMKLSRELKVPIDLLLVTVSEPSTLAKEPDSKLATELRDLLVLLLEDTADLSEEGK